MNAWLLVLVVRILGVGALGALAGLTVTLLVTWLPVPLPAMVLGAMLFVMADLALLPWKVRHHRVQGRFGPAMKEIEILSRIAPTKGSQARAKLTLASLCLASGQVERGGSLLRSLPREILPDPLKTTWDLNQAYYLLATHRDPIQAFQIADQVPSQTDPACPPAFPPTRGLALLAMGHTREAITDLSRALQSHSMGAWERAETHYHLAQAWKALGHPAYATDHLLRTCNTCAASPYAERASEEISKSLDSSAH